MLNPQSFELSLAKLPVPRITSPNKTGLARHRVRRACTACGKQKTKCSGGQPCDRCRETGVGCVYGDWKRERTQRRLKELETQVHDYDSLLRRLQSRVTIQDQQLIGETLARYSGVNSAESAGNSDSEVSTPAATSSISADYIEEDFNRSKASQATGYVGGHSETSWMRDLKRETKTTVSFLGATASDSSTSDPDSNSLNTVSYFLDDHDLSVDEDVEPYNRPSPDVAGSLLRVYFYTVHPSFPVLAKGPFMKQYAVYSSRPGLRPPAKWVTILNLVFAIAAKYSVFVHEPWCSDLDDPDVYFSRARKLNASNNQPFNHPDIQQVQVEGLTSFYLMVIRHINRAWRVCGISIRSATALGMYLRNKSIYTSNESKEIRYRIWWSIYTLENTLSVMTGRPTSSVDRFCTVPLPIPFDEEQFQDSNIAHIFADLDVCGILKKSTTPGPFNSPAPGLAGTSPTERHRSASCPAAVEPNISLYFLRFVQLTLIMRRAIDLLYSPGFIKQPWPQVRAAIKDLIDEIEVWLSSLPEIFRFTVEQKTKSFERQRWSLAFRFYSTTITITRPSLCRFDRKGSDSEPSAKGRWVPANVCIDAACQMLKLLPDEPDILWLFRVSPWWCVLHYIMQSIAVLLIELGFRSKYKPYAVSDVSLHVEKAMRWLHSMASDSPAAQRALEVCHDLYQRLAPVSCRMLLGLQTEGQSILTYNTTMHPTFQTAYDEYMPTDPDPAALASPTYVRPENHLGRV